MNTGGLCVPCTIMVSVLPAHMSVCPCILVVSVPPFLHWSVLRPSLYSGHLGIPPSTGPLCTPSLHLLVNFEPPPSTSNLCYSSLPATGHFCTHHHPLVIFAAPSSLHLSLLHPPPFTSPLCIPNPLVPSVPTIIHWSPLHPPPFTGHLCTPCTVHLCTHHRSLVTPVHLLSSPGYLCTPPFLHC